MVIEPARDPRRHLSWRWVFYLLAPALLWLALRSLDWGALVAALRQLGTVEIIILALVNLVVLMALAARWWVLLGGLGASTSLLRATAYRVASFAVSYFTPGPQFGGEPLQAHLAWQQEGMAPGPALASVLLDKIIELIANFSFLLVGSVALVSLPAGEQAPILLILLPLILLGIPLAYASTLGSGRAPLSDALNRVNSYLLRWFQISDLLATVEQAETVAGAFWRAKRLELAKAVFASLISWSMLLLEYYLLLRFLGLRVSGWQLLAVLAAARLAILLPFPGGLGSLELAQLLVMGKIGYSPEAGIAVALIIHARDVIVGAIGLLIGARLLRD